MGLVCFEVANVNAIIIIMMMRRCTYVCKQNLNRKYVVAKISCITRLTHHQPVYQMKKISVLVTRYWIWNEKRTINCASIVHDILSC